jgi:hypothetical protein
MRPWTGSAKPRGDQGVSVVDRHREGVVLEGVARLAARCKVDKKVVLGILKIPIRHAREIQ